MFDATNPDFELVARALSGNAQEADEAVLKAWAGDDLGRKQLLMALRDAWAAADQDTASLYDGAAFASRVWADVHGGQREVPVGPSSKRRYAAWGTLLAVACAVLGFWIARPALPHEAREYVAVAGERSTVQLPDGSQLILGPASRVVVPGGYGHPLRTVMLKGEGYFSVRHDGRHPFAVHTARGVTRDVGTTFVVHAYADDPDWQVTVAEGEVALDSVRGQPADAALHLTRAMTADIDANGHILVQRDIDITDALGWTQGALTFHDTPLRQAIKELGRAFNLNITLADTTLGATVLTASFKNQPVDEVLDLVARAVDVRVERNGRQVILHRARPDAFDHRTVPKAEATVRGVTSPSLNRTERNG